MQFTPGLENGFEKTTFFPVFVSFIFGQILCRSYLILYFNRDL